MLSRCAQPADISAANSPPLQPDPPDTHHVSPRRNASRGARWRNRFRPAEFPPCPQDLPPRPAFRDDRFGGISPSKAGPSFGQQLASSRLAIETGNLRARPACGSRPWRRWEGPVTRGGQLLGPRRQSQRRPQNLAISPQCNVKPVRARQSRHRRGTTSHASGQASPAPSQLAHSTRRPYSAP